MSGHPTIQRPSNVPEEFDDINDHYALAFDYYENTYSDWLDMKDDFERYKPTLEERYSQCILQRRIQANPFASEEERKHPGRSGEAE